MAALQETRRSGVGRRFWPAWAALGVGLLATGALTGFLWVDAARRDQIRFDALRQSLIEHLDNKVEKYEAGLDGLRDLFTYSEWPPQSQWDLHLARMDLDVVYGGMVEVGYAKTVMEGDLRSPSEPMREVMGNEFVMPEFNPPTDWYYPVFYRSTATGVARAPLGGQMMDSFFGPFITNARNKDGPEVTDRFLVQKQPGGPAEAAFRMFVPVYWPSGGEGRDTMTKYSFRGVVFGTFLVDEFLRYALAGVQAELGFEIYDGPDPATAHRLNERFGLGSAADRQRRPDLVNNLFAWPMFGDRWAVMFYPLAEFERNSPRRNAWIALGAGLIATAAVSVSIRGQVQKRLAAESHAVELAEARDVVQSLSRQRETLSRDLHDGVLQSLYALSLGLQKMRRLLDRREWEQATTQVGTALDSLELAMGEVRRHLGQAGVSALEAPGLATALATVAESMERQGGLSVQANIEAAAARRVPGEAAVHLVQIAREAVSNAMRHSGCRTIAVLLRGQAAGVDLEIRDDGAGFDPLRAGGLGCGLKNMAARAGELGAVFRLESAPGQGTRVLVHLPGPALRSNGAAAAGPAARGSAATSQGLAGAGASPAAASLVDHG